MTRRAPGPPRLRTAGDWSRTVRYHQFWADNEHFRPHPIGTSERRSGSILSVTESVADLIWNRAALADHRTHGMALQIGDRALRALLVAHGLIMNGGVFHCVHEALPASELEAAMTGYAYFGFDDVVTILREATAIESPWEESHDAAFLDFDARYATAIPTDAVIANRFEIRLTTYPQDFAPVNQRPISPG